MKLSDLSNPKAASAAIEALKKRFKERCCMAPDKNSCKGKIVSAHTLSEAAVLRRISRGGFVYSPRTNLYPSELHECVSFDLLGVGETSVFYGFCEHHDKSLFSSIEDHPFICSHQQNFLHAYRAVAKESYLKRRQAETSPTVEMVRQIHGFKEDQWIDDSMLLYQQFASLLGADEMDQCKDKFDKILLKEDWSRLVTWVIEFEKKPSVVCSAPYSPDFDFEGEPLQDFGNVDITLKTMIVNVFPTDTGGFALFSYLDTDSAVCENLVASLLRQPHLTSALIWFIFGYFENIAISPDWFESTALEFRKQLKAHFIYSLDPTNFSGSRLDLCPEYIDDWQPKHVFRI